VVRFSVAIGAKQITFCCFFSLALKANRAAAQSKTLSFWFSVMKHERLLTFVVPTFYALAACFCY
jgi:hypothetical protein